MTLELQWRWLVLFIFVLLLLLMIQGYLLYSQQIVPLSSLVSLIIIAPLT